jgi:hypothetical protein
VKADNPSAFLFFRFSLKDGAFHQLIQEMLSSQIADELQLVAHPVGEEDPRLGMVSLQIVSMKEERQASFIPHERFEEREPDFAVAYYRPERLRTGKRVRRI